MQETRDRYEHIVMNSGGRWGKPSFSNELIMSIYTYMCVYLCTHLHTYNKGVCGCDRGCVHVYLGA